MHTGRYTIVNFLDYLSSEQTIDFEIELNDSRIHLPARVAEIDSEVLTVKLDESDDVLTIQPGTKGIVWGKKKGLKFSLYVEVTTVREKCFFTLKHIPSRTHLRVDAFLQFSYCKISETEYAEKRKRYIQNTTQENDPYLYPPSRYGSEESDSASIPIEIIQEIHSIHRKLDFIIKFLGKSAQEEDIFNKKPVEVNISGSGLKFICDEALSRNDLLDIKMVLPVSSGIIIDLVGQVTRSTPVADTSSENAKGLREVAARFVAVNEDDREFIIRYVFRRQRELLRSE